MTGSKVHRAPKSRCLGYASISRDNLSFHAPVQEREVRLEAAGNPGSIGDVLHRSDDDDVFTERNFRGKEGGNTLKFETPACPKGSRIPSVHRIPPPDKSGSNQVSSPLTFSRCVPSRAMSKMNKADYICAAASAAGRESPSQLDHRRAAQSHHGAQGRTWFGTSEQSQPHPTSNFDDRNEQGQQEKGRSNQLCGAKPGAAMSRTT